MESSKNDLPLAGKSALVTGGSRSIGAAIARRLAADGAKVAITYSASPDKAQAVVAQIEAEGGRALAIRADAGNPAEVRAAVAKTAQAFDGLDILVNNAGIAQWAPIEQVSFEDYERMLAVNVTGVFVATQEAARVMKGGGRIVHIGSSMTRYAIFGGASIYTLTKGAVAGFTRDQLDVSIEESQLVIRGRQQDDKTRQFLHRGIAARQFQRTFVLADGMEVMGADLRNGLLSIDLVRPQPERIVKSIAINAEE